MKKQITKINPRLVYITENNLQNIENSYNEELSTLLYKLNLFLISINDLYIGGEAEYNKVELIKYIDSIIENGFDTNYQNNDF